MSMTSEFEASGTPQGPADRATERRSFFLSTPIRTDFHDGVDARIRNLSASGMMIELTATPDPDFAPGMRMSAELRGIGKVTGEFVWANGRRYGVKFDNEIDPELARKPVSSGSKTPDYAKALIVPDRVLYPAKRFPGR
jgi:hypothetical protein